MKTRVFSGFLVSALLFVVLLAAPANATGVHLQLRTTNVIVNPDDVFDVEYYVFEADDPFNAFDVVVRFDPTRLSYVAPANNASQRGQLMLDACSNNFHIFVPPLLGDSLLATMSLLCAGVSVTGPGVIYHVQFRAGATTGPTTISIGPSSQFYNAGFFVNPLETQDLNLCITTCVVTDVGDQPTKPAQFAMQAPSPNPWSRGEASFAFDLPASGLVRLTLHDIGGRIVAAHPSAWFQAGRHIIKLEYPGVKAGVYYARLHSGQGDASRPIVITGLAPVR